MAVAHRQIDALLLRLDALELRLDARRKASDPGQMDLFSGGGPGTGKPCGEGHIAAPLKCHKGEGSGAPPAAGPAAMDPARPFSGAQLAAFAEGVRKRFIAVGPVRQTGGDLAASLTKLAKRPGLAGENARKLLAFVHTEEPLFNVTAFPWGDLEGRFKIGRGAQREATDALLSAIRSMGLATPERLEALRQDRSPVGKRSVEALEKAIETLHTGYEDDRVKKLRADLAALPPGRARARQAATSQLDHATTMAAAVAYTHLLDVVQDASIANASGVYVPGSRQTWVLSRAGGRSAAVAPEAFDAGALESEVAIQLEESASRSTPYRLDEMKKGLTSTIAVLLGGSAPGLTTHIHELGHLVQYTAAQVARERVAIHGRYRIHRRVDSSPMADDLVKAKRGPSPYASTNAQEAFAESFIGYVVAPETMKRTWPQLYGWVDKTLAQAQRNATELKGLPEDEDWSHR